MKSHTTTEGQKVQMERYSSFFNKEAEEEDGAIKN